MTNQQPNNPLHGVTLERMLAQLVEHHGWVELGRRVNINCFKSDPSIKSSLTFLRKTPWARKKVEDLYLRFDRGARKRLEKNATRTASTPSRVPPKKPRADG